MTWHYDIWRCRIKHFKYKCECKPIIKIGDQEVALFRPNKECKIVVVCSKDKCYKIEVDRSKLCHDWEFVSIVLKRNGFSDEVIAAAKQLLDAIEVIE